MMVSLHPEYVMAHQLFPTAIDQTQINCYWLFPESTITNGMYHPNQAVDFWDKTNRQDWRICEQSQRGIQSKKYSPGPYSGQESLLAAFDRYYLQALNRK